jgi:hypothetical protein
MHNSLDSKTMSDAFVELVFVDQFYYTPPYIALYMVTPFAFVIAFFSLIQSKIIFLSIIPYSLLNNL